MREMRRFLRPAWLLSHLLVLALLVTMINLGLWQLRRLDQRLERNDLLGQRSAEPLLPVAELAASLGIAVGSDGVEGSASVGQAEYRPTSAVGRYLASEEVVVRNRSLAGSPGVWVLTPLLLEDGSGGGLDGGSDGGSGDGLDGGSGDGSGGDLEDGSEDGSASILIVNRGWVRQTSADASSRPPAPAADGRVEVSGIVRLSETRRGLGVADPPEGRLESLARIDIRRYAEQLELDVYPFYLQLESQEPPPEEFPVPLQRPPLDSGPHLSYALQWFVFSTIAVVGYPLVLWRLHRRRFVPAVEPSSQSDT